MRISLALGGGGSKGFAHIGVLQVLETEGFDIAAVAGTSAGGLIGSLYAAGYTPEYILRKMAELDQRKLYGHLEEEQASLLGSAGITQLLEKHLGDRKFSELRIPFAVTAVDLNTAEPVVLKEGLVIEAVLATIAVPGILPPRQRGDMLLVDGGVSNPVPVNVARSICPRVPVVASVLSQKPGGPSEPAHLQLESESAIIERITRLKVAQALNIFLRSLDVSSRLLAELRLEIDRPEVVIRPNVSDIGVLDRVDVEELAHLGELAARNQIEDIKKATSWLAQLAVRVGL